MHKWQLAACSFDLDKYTITINHEESVVAQDGKEAIEQSVVEEYDITRLAPQTDFSTQNVRKGNLHK